MTAPASPRSKHYVLTGELPGMMLLYNLPLPDDEDSWALGHRFVSPVPEPVVVTICSGYEQAQLLPYFNVGLMSDAFFAAVRSAGVDNIDAYDAVIRSEDGTIEHRGYKAVNILGLVRAADTAQTRFEPGHEDRLLDAAMNGLVVDPAKAHDFLMFRLAENVGVVLVHERVKAAIEACDFGESVVFRDPGDLVTL